MKLTIKEVYANELEYGGYGDVFDALEDVETEYPEANVLKGYCVCYAESFEFEEMYFEAGLVPDKAKDWHWILEEAISEMIALYKERIVAIETEKIELEELVNNAFEQEIKKHLKSIDDLDDSYLYWNWESQEFENYFICEDHINENFINDFDLIQQIANKQNANIATVVSTAPLIIQEGIHYANRYGYVVYLGNKLDREYYI